jgi:hypothetical protein
MAVQNPFFGKRDNDAFTSRNTLGSGIGTAGTGGSPAGAVTPSSSVASSSSAPRQASAASQDSPGSKLTVGPNIKLKGVEITDCDTLVVEGTVEATMDSRVIQIAEQGSGKIRYGKVVIEEGGELTGQIEAGSSPRSSSGSAVASSASSLSSSSAASSDSAASSSAALAAASAAASLQPRVTPSLA